jgi:hypothetical protein
LDATELANQSASIDELLHAFAGLNENGGWHPDHEGKRNARVE